MNTKAWESKLRRRNAENLTLYFCVEETGECEGL